MNLQVGSEKIADFVARCRSNRYIHIHKAITQCIFCRRQSQRKQMGGQAKLKAQRRAEKAAGHTTSIDLRKDRMIEREVEIKRVLDEDIPDDAYDVVERTLKKRAYQMGLGFRNVTSRIKKGVSAMTFRAIETEHGLMGNECVTFIDLRNLSDYGDPNLTKALHVIEQSAYVTWFHQRGGFPITCSLNTIVETTFGADVVNNDVQRCSICHKGSRRGDMIYPSRNHDKLFCMSCVKRTRD